MTGFCSFELTSALKPFFRKQYAQTENMQIARLLETETRDQGYAAGCARCGHLTELQ